MKQLVYDLAALLLLAKGPGVARGKKILSQSVQPFGWLYATYIRMSCFLYRILAEGPGVARGKKIEKNLKKKLQKKDYFLKKFRFYQL